MEVPGIPRPALVVLIAIAALLLLFGGTKAIGLFTQHTDTHTRTLAAAPTIVISARTADVRIIAADRDDVRLTTKEERSAWGGGHVEVSGDAARLHLGDRCRNVPVVDAPCGVRFVLEIPRDTSVRVVTGTGDLHAENLRGGADLRSGTGDLHVVGVSGPVRLRADTGDVHVAAPSPAIFVQTGTGDIDVEASRPSSILTRSATGDIVCVVPDETYAVDVRTDTGDDIISVRRDDAAPRRLVAHTQTGDVVIATDAR